MRHGEPGYVYVGRSLQLQNALRPLIKNFKYAVKVGLTRNIEERENSLRTKRYENGIVGYAGCTDWFILHYGQIDNMALREQSLKDFCKRIGEKVPSELVHGRREIYHAALPAARNKVRQMNRDYGDVTDARYSVGTEMYNEEFEDFYVEPNFDEVFFQEIVSGAANGEW